MDEKKISKEKIDNFFREYKEKTPIILMIYMIFSLSLYLLIWIFLTNKELEKIIEEDAPNSKRATIILFILPISLAIIIHFLNIFFITEISKKLIYSFSILAWSFVIFLSLQYIYMIFVILLELSLKVQVLLGIYFYTLDILVLS